MARRLTCEDVSSNLRTTLTGSGSQPAPSVYPGHHVPATFWPVTVSTALNTFEKAPLQINARQHWSLRMSRPAGHALSHLLEQLKALEALVSRQLALRIALLRHNLLDLLRIFVLGGTCCCLRCGCRCLGGCALLVYGRLLHGLLLLLCLLLLVCTRVRRWRWAGELVAAGAGVSVGLAVADEVCGTL